MPFRWRHSQPCRRRTAREFSTVAVHHPGTCAAAAGLRACQRNSGCDRNSREHRGNGKFLRRMQPRDGLGKSGNTLGDRLHRHGNVCGKWSGVRADVKRVDGTPAAPAGTHACREELRRPAMQRGLKPQAGEVQGGRHTRRWVCGRGRQECGRNGRDDLDVGRYSDWRLRGGLPADRWSLA